MIYNSRFFRVIFLGALMTVVKPQEDQDQDSAHISRTDSKK